jgi:hypothetical protein
MFDIDLEVLKKYAREALIAGSIFFFCAVLLQYVL